MSNPEVGCESFEVDGVVYRRTPFEEFSLGRAIKLQRFQTEMQFDMSIPTVQKTMMECKADFNGMKLVDGFVKFGRLTDGLDMLGQNRYRQAEILALFYNAPGEDAGSDSYKEIIEPKVAAWRALPAAFFTQTAFFLLVGFLKHSQPALDEAEKPARASDLPTS